MAVPDIGNSHFCFYNFECRDFCLLFTRITVEQLTNSTVFQFIKQNLANIVSYKIELMNQHKRKELNAVKIISNELLTEGVHYISIEKPFDFKPGQVVAIAMHANDEPRLYSIASGINKQHLSILFDVKPDGELTPPLSLVQPNDTVFISEPFGKFLCLEQPATWIATGTGIAPFISLVESARAENIQLLHGARTLDKFFFQDYLETQLGHNYLRFCTTESNEKTIAGRLTSYLENTENLPTDNKYYLCGSSQMVIDVREILIARGIAFDNIIAEIYF